MFSEVRRNKFYFPQRNGLPYDSNDCYPKIVSKKSVNYNLFSMPSNVEVDENIYRFEPKRPLPIITKKNKISQTNYREAEMQTEPYLPQPKLRTGETKLPEIVYVECNEEPDLRDIEKIERDTIRRKWEDNLRQLPMSLDEKVKQMKVFEIREQLLREKELHEIQEERFEYVLNEMNQREVVASQKCREKLLNVYKSASEMGIRERAKMEARNERKLRQLSRINNSNKIKYQKSNILKSSKSIDLGQLNLYDCPKDHKVDYECPKDHKIDLNDNRDALWIPKQKVKVVRHCMNKEKIRDNLYEEIKQHNREFDKNLEHQFSRPRCLVTNPVDMVYECGGDQEEIPLDHILIQKTIKGIVIQKSLKSGMKDNLREIHKIRRLYPIRCVTELFDGENFMPFEDEVQTQSDSCCSKDLAENDIQMLNPPEISNDEKPSEDPEMNVDLQNAITEVLQQALLIAQDTINRKILKEANEQRVQREELAQIEALKQKLNKLREELTERKTEIFYKDLIAEVIEMVIPLVIEDISEKEAIEFIMKKATEVSADACNKNITNKAKIEKFIKEILIPHIEAKSDGSNEHLIALFGSYDAFNCFIDKCFSTD
ncbi:cilia- and flagella-associated protein 91-like [Chironomus tepperi]|uniref:cilia- and flagella-associated protein 91-like n=1 Tax=Chironomus tepperi TaxID=113505 RepID=UPI00391F00DF